MPRVVCLAVLVVFAGWVSTPAEALPITYNFTATSTGQNGIFTGQGTNVTGTFTFDTDLVDIAPGTTTDFFSPVPLANQPFNNSWFATVTVGAVTVSTAANARTVGTGHHTMNFTDSAASDAFSFMTGSPVLGDDNFLILLQDTTPLPPDAITGPLGNSTAGANLSILNSLNLALFSTNTGFYIVNNATGGIDGVIDFRITSITRPVPEPGTLLLLGAGLAAGARRLRRKSAAPVVSSSVS